MICSYKKISQDGWGTNWKTSCGKEIRMEAPMDIGFMPAPLPNECGQYCAYCGKVILLKNKEIK